MTSPEAQLHAPARGAHLRLRSNRTGAKPESDDTMSPSSAEHVPASLGRFAVCAVLGTGGSSVVYDVTDDAPGKHYALKVLRDDLVLSDVERRRFLDEAARMRRVEHPALVPLVEAGELPDGRPYLLMPRISGETLARRVARGALAPEEAVRHVCTLADGLAALHAAGMVHRDVKPENVVVQDRPMLLDFGIAREIEAASSTTTARGHVRGTPAYMAPERFFGAPASVSSDVYELGVVFYIMLTGKLPWSAEAYAAERLNPPSPEAAGVSRALSVVCLRALCTRPEMRPESAQDFAAAVRAAAEEPALEGRTTADLPMITATFPASAAADDEAAEPGSRERIEPAAIAAIDTGARLAAPRSGARFARAGNLVAVVAVLAAVVALGSIRLRARSTTSVAPPASALPAPQAEAFPAPVGASSLVATSFTAPSAPSAPSALAVAAPSKSASGRGRASGPAGSARATPASTRSGSDPYLEDRR